MNGRYKKDDLVYCTNKTDLKLTTIMLNNNAININLGSGKVLDVRDDGEYYMVLFEYYIPDMRVEDPLFTIKIVQDCDLTLDNRRREYKFEHLQEN